MINSKEDFEKRVAKVCHYEPWHEDEEAYSRIDYALVLAVVIVSACWGWREYDRYQESLNRPAWSSCVVAKSELSK